MKDANHAEDWVDNLANRLQLDETSTAAQPSEVAATGLPQPHRDYHYQLKLLYKDTEQQQQKARESLMAEFDMRRAKPRSLAKFRSLEPTATLLLFTPVMLPTGYMNENELDCKPPKGHGKKPQTSSPEPAAAADPFEMLGKVFSKRHRRIRHVPYVPSVGFTETHGVFLEQADALIVVSCEPDGNLDKGAILAKQRAFVKEAAAALSEIDSETPMVCVSFGSGDEYEWEEIMLNHVWAGEKYNEDSAGNAEMLVFGPSK
jgi:hypothetical protein